MATKTTTTPKRVSKTPETFYYAEPRHFDAAITMYEFAMRAEWVVYGHPDGLEHPHNGHRAAQLWSAAHIALQGYEHESDANSVLHQTSLDLQQILFVDATQPKDLRVASRVFIAKAKTLTKSPETAGRIRHLSMLLEVHAANKDCYSMMPASRKARLS